ncbi:MAG: hypothetical protein WAN48_01935, partial [Actinomycetes bacterium]
MSATSDTALSTEELLIQADSGWGDGYTLAYGRADARVTTVMHWGVAVLCFSLVCLVTRGDGGTDWVSTVPLASFGLFAVQCALAVAATSFAWRAARKGHSYYQTDRWDNICAWTQVGAAVAGTYFVHGTTSPAWLAVGVAMAYAATLMVGISGLFLAAAVSAGALGSATFNDQWTPAGVPSTVAVIVALPMAFLLVRAVATHMYGDSENSMWQRQVLASRVRDLTEPLERAAGGDLSMAGGLVDVVGMRRGEEDPLIELTGSLDHTLGALRVLVGAVRSGGEQLGAAAGQVLVSAQEQAASAAQQS